MFVYESPYEIKSIFIATIYAFKNDNSRKFKKGDFLPTRRALSVNYVLFAVR